MQDRELFNINPEDGQAISLPPPPDYDPDDHPSLDLLYFGEISTWLRQREAVLGKRAKENRLDAESAKSVSFVLLLAGGITASTNPLAWIPFIGALIGYAMTLFQEKQTIDRMHPLPFYRGSLMDILNGFQNGGMGMERKSDFEDKASYLNAEENAEYFLLGAYLDQLGKAIAQFPPYVRFDAYRYWVTRFWRSQAIASPEEVQNHIHSSVSEDRLNWQPPKVKLVPPQRVNPFEALPDPNRPNPFALKQLPESPSEGSSGTVGRNTQLNAIEATAVPVLPQQTIDRIISDAAIVHAERRNAFKMILENPYESRAIFGAQRTGKSYFAALATQELSRRGFSIFHINLASYGTEDNEYWSHAESVRCDLPALDEGTATDYIHRAIDLVEQFYRTTGAILVFDEWSIVGNKSNRYAPQLAPLFKILADKITTFSSTGVKRAKAIWTIAPSFVAGSLTDDAKTVKLLPLCYLSIAPGRSVDWKGHKVRFSNELHSQLSNNWSDVEKPYPNGDIAGHDRIAYVDRVWMPLGIDGMKLEQFRQVQIDNEPVKIPVSQFQSINNAGEVLQPQMIDDSLSINALLDELEPESETTRMRAIYDYAKRKGGITKRSLQRGTLPALKGLSSDDLQFYLDYMYLENFLEQDEDIFYHNPNHQP